MTPTNGFHRGMSVIHDLSTYRPAAPERLAGVDLNLLVSLDALLSERHVTRAARRLGVTQSAMSHTLRRLRDLFEDPLLVRAPGGMVPTPRAEALSLTVRTGLATLGVALFEPATFDAATSTRRFRLATPDLFDAVALAPLLQQLGQTAPGVDLTAVSISRGGVWEGLASGELDVAVMPKLDGPNSTAPLWTEDCPEGLQTRTLFRDEFVVFLRQGHPALGADQGIDLERYAAARHLMVSPTGEGHGLVDDLLATAGLSRRVALRIPHFTSAPAIVATSDLVLTGPQALGALMAYLPCVSVPPPMAIPGHRVVMFWHERMTQDPGHRWLREALAGLGECPSGLGV